MMHENTGLLATAKTDRGLFSSGAEAHTVEAESESLRCVVGSLRTTGEETEVSCAVTGSLALSYIMMNHHA